MNDVERIQAALDAAPGVPVTLTSPLVLRQADRAFLLSVISPARSFRKRARILAIQMKHPFTVETDRGVMTGVAGDWLVTNHPDDDPGSDLWTISAERMAATYEEAEP